MLYTDNTPYNDCEYTPGAIECMEKGWGYGMRMRQMYVDMGVVKGVRVLREIVDMAQ